jgi:MFS-type transporter involved in bile tolerance (Atg22 family)
MAESPPPKSSGGGIRMGWRLRFSPCAASVSLIPCRGLCNADMTGSFLPVTLEQLARENGVMRSDGTPCLQPKSSSAVVSRSLLRREEDVCVLHLFGGEISTSSFALYSFSLAIMVQTIVLISIGSIADYGMFDG